MNQIISPKETMAFQWFSFPKMMCGHTITGFLTARVEAPMCSIEVENAVAFGIFPFIFTQNGSCEMSMCISTAQARAKRWCRAMRLAFPL